MITLIVLLMKLALGLVLLPFQLLLLPLSILDGLTGGKKSQRKESCDDTTLLSGIFLDETIDDYWWDN